MALSLGNLIRIYIFLSFAELRRVIVGVAQGIKQSSLSSESSIEMTQEKLCAAHQGNPEVKERQSMYFYFLFLLN